MYKSFLFFACLFFACELNKDNFLENQNLIQTTETLQERNPTKEKEGLWFSLENFENRIYYESFLCLNQPNDLLKAISKQIKNFLIIHEKLAKTDKKARLCEIAINLDYALKSRARDFYSRSTCELMCSVERGLACYDLLEKIVNDLGSSTSLRKSIFSIAREIETNAERLNFDTFFKEKFPNEFDYDADGKARLKDTDSFRTHKQMKVVWEDEFLNIKLQPILPYPDYLKYGINELFYTIQGINQDLLGNNVNKISLYKAYCILNSMTNYANEAITFCTSLQHIGRSENDLKLDELVGLNTFILSDNSDLKTTDKVMIYAKKAYRLDISLFFGQGDKNYPEHLILPGTQLKYLGLMDGFYSFEQIIL